MLPSHQIPHHIHNLLQYLLPSHKIPSSNHHQWVTNKLFMLVCMHVSFCFPHPVSIRLVPPAPTEHTNTHTSPSRSELSSPQNTHTCTLALSPSHEIRALLLYNTHIYFVFLLSSPCFKTPTHTHTHTHAPCLPPGRSELKTPTHTTPFLPSRPELMHPHAHTPLDYPHTCTHLVLLCFLKEPEIEPLYTQTKITLPNSGHYATEDF